MEQIQEGRSKAEDDLIWLWKHKFVIEGEHRIAEVAKQIPMSYDTLYADIVGIRTMPMTMRIKVAEAVKDKELLDKAFDGSVFEVEYRERARGRREPLSAETLTLISQVGRFAEAVKKDLADHKLDDKEKTELQKLIHKMRAELEEIADTVGA